jgi:hypothetical protein
MASGIMQTSKRKHKRIFPRDRQSGTPYKDSKRLRLSDIEVRTKVINLPYQYQKLFFDLNVKYNPDFNPNMQIALSDLSTELVNQFCECFKVSLYSLGLAQDKIVVEQDVIHDMYIFDVKPFFKLKRKAPLLFELYKYFVARTPFNVCGDNNDTEVYDSCEFCLEDRKDDTSETVAERRKFKTAYQSLEKDKQIAAEMKIYQKDILEKIKEYHPSNKSLQTIKEALLKWIEFDFTALYDYPYQYYSSDDYFNKIKASEEDYDLDSEGDYFDYDNDIKDFTNFIFFCYNENKIVKSMIHENFADIFNNVYITSPCWTIDLEYEQRQSRENIIQFDRFSVDYFDIIELLETL